MAFKSWDLNDNGIPDYREPWLYKLGLKLIVWSVRNFASPHTLAAKHVGAAEGLLRELEKFEQQPPRE